MTRAHTAAPSQQNSSVSWSFGCEWCDTSLVAACHLCDVFVNATFGAPAVLMYKCFAHLAIASIVTASDFRIFSSNGSFTLQNQCRKANNKEIANENQRIKDPSAAKWREVSPKLPHACIAPLTTLTTVSSQVFQL